MSPPVSIGPQRVLSERLQSTRIVTSLALALLLLIGIWTATHTETTPSHGSASVAAPFEHPTELTPAVALHPQEPWTDLTTVCILGILCTILLALAARLAPRRRPSPHPQRGFRQAFVAAHRPMWAPPALTPQQLGISRV